MEDDDRLFPIVAEAVQRKFRRHIEKAGVKKIRVHALRHSHCVYLIHQGVAPLVIKERLGHTYIKITLNTYGHLYPNQQRQVADMLNSKKKIPPPIRQRYFPIARAEPSHMHLANTV